VPCPRAGDYEGEATMILVADAHISAEPGGDRSFVEFLSALSATEHDVLFLGDIFDLWVGFPRYEGDAHRAFLSWCLSERPRRRIWYVEGNHEYFVSSTHRSVFSGCDPEELSFPGAVLAVHGDAIDRGNRSNLFFRYISKSILGHLVLRFLPFGPAFALGVKGFLNARDSGCGSFFADGPIRAFANDRFAQGTRTIFVGHYHKAFEYGDGAGGRLYVVPAWCDSESVGLYNADTGAVCFGRWQALLE